MNEVMVGAGMKVKVPVLVAVPPGVVTVTAPVAPLPTVAVIGGGVDDGEGGRRRAAEGHRGRAGEVGAGDGHHRPRAALGRGERGDGRRRMQVKVKVPVLVAVPPGVVTVMAPVAPLPTVAVIWVSQLTVKEAAAVPPKVTAVAPVKLVPVMVTAVPAARWWG